MLLGIHHITAMASQAQRNLDFYERDLAQRFVKRTVNFDDPTTYHLYYGDKTGRPGTIMTFFPWAHLPPARHGTGEVGHSVYAITKGTLGFWENRLKELNVSTEHVTSFGQEQLRFADPDGLLLALVEQEGIETEPWDHPLPVEQQPMGFAGAILEVPDLDDATKTMEILGLKQEQTEESQRRFHFSSGPQFIDLHLNESMGQMGAGSVHHIAFRVENDEEQERVAKTLREAGLYPTGQKDRQYFRSVYFQTPMGILFELATDEPGFLYDEEVEHLGEALRLPPWVEDQRAMIEERIAPITLPRTKF